MFVFKVDRWSGGLKAGGDETTDAGIFALDELPDIPGLYRETLDDLQRYSNRVSV